MSPMLKRMLSGATAAALFLFGGGIAEAGSLRTTLEVVDASGNIRQVAQLESSYNRPICVVVSPGDNAANVQNTRCVVVNAANRHVVIGPTDNVMVRSIVISPTDNVVVGPTDNVVISPTDNVVISPTDNASCWNRIVISPGDNLSTRCASRQVVISPSDNLTARWMLVTDSAGRAAAIDLTSSGTSSLTARTTVTADAAQRLLDLGVRADEIDLYALGRATTGLAHDPQASSRLSEAAVVAVDRWENAACQSTASLSDRLCGALR